MNEAGKGSAYRKVDREKWEAFWDRWEKSHMEVPTDECPQCLGSGEFAGKECSTCGGKGKINE